MKRNEPMTITRGGVLVVLAALAFLAFLQTTSAMKEDPSGDGVSGGSLVSEASATAQDPLWHEITPVSLNALTSDRQSRPTPERYKAFELNEAALTNLLADAPMEFTEAAKDPRNEITLPAPDGALARFRFVESPIMEPQVAAQFPETRTYRGWGIDDPTATMRFIKTRTGFSAIVLSRQGAFYIDPLSRDDSRKYASYSMGDAVEEGVACLVGPGDGANAGPAGGPTLKSAARDNILAPQVSGNSTGTVLRTFNLAVAATGEYTDRYNGNVPDAMNGIIQTVNFVSAIFERELAVRFNLVTNTSIIFTEPYRDPYISADWDGFLDENQETLDLLIGHANYDIGHVLDARWEGGKATGLACYNGHKGKGATSSAAVNAGGPFETHFKLSVAHEIGHQFGAEHTFNGDCGNSGNRNDDTAYEPGCGRTIMSYGLNRIPYFHGTSLQLMSDFLDTCACAGTYNNNNTPPQVTVPVPTSFNPYNAAFFIPAQTPFTLTASGSDAEDTLTYSWESIDNGSPGPWDADRGDNPLFASQRPTEDPSGTFPPLDELLPPPAYTVTPSLMATTSRSLRFMVTARDDHGGFDQGAVVVRVVGDSGPFVVTAPTTGTQALAGSSMTVTWDVANTNTGIINTQLVRIRLSTDNGVTFPAELSASTLNNGSFTFTVPCANTQAARIKVEAIGNIFVAFSPAFTITGAPTITTTGSLTVTKGGPPVSAVIAAVTDQGAAGALTVMATTLLPTGVTLNLTHNDGTILAQMATAECGSVGGTHPIAVQVTNSVGCTASTSFNLIVQPNPSPTLGSYGNVSVIGGQSVTVSPSAPPADANNNLSELRVWGTTPTLSATVLPVLSTGEVTIYTDGSTQPGTYQIHLQVSDSCHVANTTYFFLTVENAPPQITANGNPARTTQGGTSVAPVVVATISDLQDAPQDLTVVANAPAGLQVSVTKLNGTVSATATATCAVVPGTYNVTLTVTDSDGGTASANLLVIVDPNVPPTLGTYFDSAVTAGGSFINVPNAVPSDPNNPTVPVTVSVGPQALPNGGQLFTTPDGRIHIQTMPATAPAPYQIVVTATDACGAQTTKFFRLTVRSAFCIAQQSSIFVADTGNHRIQRFNGNSWNVIGSGTPGSGLGQFMNPEAVVASQNGQRVYVADTGNSRIQWSQNGGVTWAVFASGLIPQGLVLDRDGNLYLSDSRDNQVMRYAGGVPGAPIVLAASGSGSGRVSNPNGLAIDCRMNLYVADTGNNRIMVIATADSTMIPNTGTLVAGPGAGVNPAQVTAPQGVAVENGGKLYIADTGNNRVLSMTSAPMPGAAAVLCLPGPGLGQVGAPEGVTIATFSAGPLAGGSSLIVSDTTNNRIQARVLPAGPWMLLGGPAQFKLPSKIR